MSDTAFSLHEPLEFESSREENKRNSSGGDGPMDPRDPTFQIYRELTEIKSDIRDIRGDASVNLRWIIGIVIGSAFGICGFLSALITHIVK